MRILIDVLHPAHVHFFRNFHTEMEERGHELCITARSKDRSLELLDRYGLPYVQLSTQKSGGAGLAIEMAQRTRRLVSVIREFRPDVLTGIMGPSIAVAGRLTRLPSVVFYDTEFAKQTNTFVYPLAHRVCTPDCYQGKVRGHHVQYAGYHELAYLHPNRFTPEPQRLASFGVEPGEPYSIVRFVSWQAIHDRGERGLTGAQKRYLVKLLERRGRVLVSSEAPLPDDLAALEVKGPVEDIHHLMASAQLMVGESATMSSESAVLGVPAVFIASTGRGYTDDEEHRYGLVRHFTEDRFDDAVDQVEKFLASSPRTFGEQARARLLGEKIDVTQWMVDFFEKSLATNAQVAP
jgi:predicted glycosyltransferase